MSDITQLIVFRLDERYALPLSVVERVVRAVEVTPLPRAPVIVLGAIDVHGRVLPVLNVRRRFRMPDLAISPADWFLLAHTARHTVALVTVMSYSAASLQYKVLRRDREVRPDLRHRFKREAEMLARLNHVVSNNPNRRDATLDAGQYT